jgi:hypothetical protein
VLSVIRTTKQQVRALFRRHLVSGEKCAHLFLVLAMKRSGHHAFIQWLASGLDSAKHINNAVDGWEERKWKCPRHSGGEISYFGAKQEETKNLIVSIEDFDIDDWWGFGFENFDTYRKAKHVTSVVFVRDFLNWTASCMKTRESHEGRDVYEALSSTYINDRREQKRSRIELWETQLQEFSSQSRIPNSIPVSYARWLQSKEYRAALGIKLGIQPSETSLSEVARFGGGSSFDGVSHDGSAENMDALNRYHNFLEDAEFQELLKGNSDNIELSKQYLL